MKTCLNILGLFTLLYTSTSYSQHAQNTQISQLASTYGDHAQIVIDNYNKIINDRGLSALKAIDALKKDKAYSVVALAMAYADRSLIPPLLDALIRAEPHNLLVTRALFKQLQRESKVFSRQGGEDSAAGHLVKERMVQMLLIQTDVTTGEIDVNSTSQIDQFLDKIKEATPDL